ncbi:MAG TPA: hypothetical protein VLU92_11215 [Candidatus Dormibacteraeota bacterium]|nr:hypothetical protein [Candidatus Dormibacteraeota bacterium]
MSKTEGDPLGPAFTWRLRSALDRVTPPRTPPRYLSASIARSAPLRFAPAALAAALAGVVVLAAFATTGSANPVVWTQRAVSSIESAGHTPAVVPGPESSPSPGTESPQAPAVAAPTHAPEHEGSPQPEPSEAPERSPSPQPRESPEPVGHSGTSSPAPSESPSPNPHDG